MVCRNSLHCASASLREYFRIPGLDRFGPDRIQTKAGSRAETQRRGGFGPSESGGHRPGARGARSLLSPLRRCVAARVLPVPSSGSDWKQTRAGPRAETQRRGGFGPSEIRGHRPGARGAPSPLSFAAPLRRCASTSVCRLQVRSNRIRQRPRHVLAQRRSGAEFSEETEPRMNADRHG